MAHSARFNTGPECIGFAVPLAVERFVLSLVLMGWLLLLSSISVNDILLGGGGGRGSSGGSFRGVFSTNYIASGMQVM